MWHDLEIMHCPYKLNIAYRYSFMGEECNGMTLRTEGKTCDGMEKKCTGKAVKEGERESESEGR